MTKILVRLRKGGEHVGEKIDRATWAAISAVRNSGSKNAVVKKSAK